MERTLTTTCNGLTYAAFTAASLLAIGVPEIAITNALNKEIIDEAHARIDAVCDKSFAESLSRQARYAAKETEARAFLAAEKPESVNAADYPILAAEAAVKDISLIDQAKAVIKAVTAANTLVSQAEAARARITLVVKTASSEEEKALAAEKVFTEFMREIST